MSEGKKEILLGDCLELMKQLPDKSVDMILCDLPYGTTACKWDAVIPFDKLWEQYHRVSKANAAILLFASQPFTTDLIQSNRKYFRYELIWAKNQWSGHMNAKRQFLKAHEQVLVFYKENPTYNIQYTDYSESTKKRYKNGDFVKKSYQSTNEVYGGIKSVEVKIDYDRGKAPGSVLDFKCVHNGNFKRLHPTQKPVDLCRYLIRTFTNENDLVLDNTAGSGTTAEACLHEKRQFIVMEKEEKYYEIIKKRVGDFVSQMRLF